MSVLKILTNLVLIRNFQLVNMANYTFCMPIKIKNKLLLYYILLNVCKYIIGVGGRGIMAFTNDSLLKHRILNFALFTNRLSFVQ